MNFTDNHKPDPDDFFSETRMSFGDHLEDLRIHLWRAIAGFLIALVASFAIGKPMLRFIAAPVEGELGRFWDNYYGKKYQEIAAQQRAGQLGNDPPVEVQMRFNTRTMKKALGIKSDGGEPTLNILPSLEPIMEKLELEDWLNAAKVEGGGYTECPVQITNATPLFAQLKMRETKIKKPTLSTLNVQEAFMVYVKVSVVTGFILASPWIFYQIWAFVAAGLYPHEKRLVNVFLPVSIGLFLIGVVVCQFMVIPKAVEALLWFNQWLDLEPDLRLNEWLGFAIFMPLIFGVSFQTPLVMLFLERIGVVTVEQFRAKRRIAWFVLAVFAAIITPSTDAVSMIYLWVPMFLLYELGILICLYAPQRQTFDMDVPESEELIEV